MNFEEQFPSIVKDSIKEPVASAMLILGKEKTMKDFLTKYCLDKKRVKDIITSYITDDYNPNFDQHEQGFQNALGVILKELGLE